jgi:hypothetical protein
VTYNARLWLGQAWALVFLAAIGAVLAGSARAQGPDPVPAPTHAKALRPEPAPTARAKASSSRPTNSSTVTVQSRTPRSPIVVTPPAPIAPQPAFTPARVQRARVEPPKKLAAKPQRARAPSKKPEVKWTLGARERLGAAVDSSPDGMLLAGGLALFVLLLGETIFLALSVRFLRRTT